MEYIHTVITEIQKQMDNRRSFKGVEIRADGVVLKLLHDYGTHISLKVYHKDYPEGWYQVPLKTL